MDAVIINNRKYVFKHTDAIDPCSECDLAELCQSKVSFSGIMCDMFDNFETRCFKETEKLKADD